MDYAISGKRKTCPLCSTEYLLTYNNITSVIGYQKIILLHEKIIKLLFCFNLDVVYPQMDVWLDHKTQLQLALEILDQLHVWQFQFLR